MEYFKRLGNFWFPGWTALVWLLLALPALYFFQTTIHEGTHALTALAASGSFPKLAPFPHGTSDGRVLNGVTLSDRDTQVTVVERTNCDSPAKTRNTRLAGFIAMPQFVDLILIAIFTLIFIFTPVSNPLLRFALRAWYLGACIDFMYNTARGLIGGCNKFADWSRFMLRSDIDVPLFVFLTWILWLLVLCHFVWVYWSRWGRDAVAKIGFWDYRWVAFVLGILSLIAVIVSIAVSDPDIDKGSVAFILPFVLQVIALCWYWLYFGLTFKYKSG